MLLMCGFHVSLQSRVIPKRLSSLTILTRILFIVGGIVLTLLVNSNKIVLDALIDQRVSIHHSIKRFSDCCSRSEMMLNFPFTIFTKSYTYVSVLYPFWSRRWSRWSITRRKKGDRTPPSGHPLVAFIVTESLLRVAVMIRLFSMLIMKLTSFTSLSFAAD